MSRFDEIFKHPAFCGEVDDEETFQILQKAPKYSYIFRIQQNPIKRLRLLVTYIHPDYGYLMDSTVEREKNLDDKRYTINEIFEILLDINKPMPVSKRNPLKLSELASYAIYKNRDVKEIMNLPLPRKIRIDLAKYGNLRLEMGDENLCKISSMFDYPGIVKHNTKYYRKLLKCCATPGSVCHEHK